MGSTGIRCLRGTASCQPRGVHRECCSRPYLRGVLLFDWSVGSACKRRAYASSRDDRQMGGVYSASLGSINSILGVSVQRVHLPF